MSFQELYIMALSALPVTELRVTIPLAITLGIRPWFAFVLGVAGNLTPILPVYFLLTPLGKWLGCFSPTLELCLQRLLLRTRSRGEQVRKYGLLGLLLFVAVPVPGTGAWTGTVLAWLFGFPAWITFVTIAAGVILAGLIVTLVTIGVFNAFFYAELELLSAGAVLGVIIYLCAKWWMKKGNLKKR